MIDTHVHLDFDSFDIDRGEVIERFFGDDGKAMINIGVDEKTIKSTLEIARYNKNIFCAIGYHPHEADKKGEGISNKKIIELEKTASKERKVVAIGEIGLDYSIDSDKTRRKQKMLFRKQIIVAKKLDIPVIAHCRDAHDDVLQIISQEEFSDVNFVLHCFSANFETTKKFLLLRNTFFSFTGNTTFSKGNEHLFDVISIIPLARIMVETDCPFLAPVPMRGKRNEPVFVKYIIEKIAQLKKISFKKMENATDQNAENFFCLS